MEESSPLMALWKRKMYLPDGVGYRMGREGVELTYT